MASNHRLAIDLNTRKIRVPVLRHYVSVSILFLMVVESSVLALAYDLTMYLHFGRDIGSSLLRIEPYLYALIMVCCITTQGLYRIHYRHTQLGTFARIVLSFTLGTLLLLVLPKVVPQFTLWIDNSAIVSAQLIAFAPILIAHVLFFARIDHSTLKTNVLVLGAGQKANSLSKLRRRSDLRTANIKGYVRCVSDQVRVPADKIIDACSDELINFVLENDIEEILVAPDDRRICFPTQQLLYCKMRGVNIIDLCSFFERETGQIKLDLLHPSWLIFSEGFDRNHGRALARRAMDVSISAVALLFLFPVMLLTALAISWDSRPQGGSVFYRQKRVGLNGAVFEILKFRSMVPNAEKNGCAQWAIAGDQRITKVGRVIRKYRIDELPQLINVLRGDMSLVGPRPERPEIVQELRQSIPYYDDRHHVRPGITGWAQINYPYGASEHDAIEKLQYDLYYTKHNSLLLDLAIMLQTLEVIFFKKGSR